MIFAGFNEGFLVLEVLETEVKLLLLSKKQGKKELFWGTFEAFLGQIKSFRSVFRLPLVLDLKTPKMLMHFQDEGILEAPFQSESSFCFQHKKRLGNGQVLTVFYTPQERMYKQIEALYKQPFSHIVITSFALEEALMHLQSEGVPGQTSTVLISGVEGSLVSLGVCHGKGKFCYVETGLSFQDVWQESPKFQSLKERWSLLMGEDVQQVSIVGETSGSDDRKTEAQCALRKEQFFLDLKTCFFQEQDEKWYKRRYQKELLTGAGVLVAGVVLGGLLGFALGF